MKILLIDDDKALCRTLGQALEEAGHLAECAFNGASGEHFAKYSDFDLIILDLILPDKNGVEVCRTLRAEGVAAPILMLTAKTATEIKVHGLDSGADDYLCKPFDYDELFARVRALQRRPTKIRPPVIEISGTSINIAAHEVRCGFAEIKLTAAEYRMLEYFVTNPNALITRTMLEEHLWDAEKPSESNAIDTLVKKLRQKLGWNPKTGPIKTLRGEGYKLTL